jgi:hypothetical protein
MQPSIQVPELFEIWQAHWPIHIREAAPNLRNGDALRFKRSAPQRNGRPVLVSRSGSQCVVTVVHQADEVLAAAVGVTFGEH